MSRRLIINAGSTALLPFTKACIGFYLSPIILHALGNYDYGIWEIVFSIIGYMGILDLGLQPAIVRFVARYSALKDRERLQKIYSTSIAFLGAVGVVLCLGMWVAAFVAPPFLSPPDGERGRYFWFIGIIAFQLLIVFTGSVFDCYLKGLQHYTIIAKVNLICLIIGAVIVAIFLTHGYGLITLAIVDVSSRLIKFSFFAWWLSRPNNGGFLFCRNDISRETLSEMFSFGVKNLVYALAVRMASATDPILIGGYLGAAVVPFYVIPANLLGYGRGLVTQASEVLMPYFSEMDAHGDRDATRRAFYKTSRYTIGVIAPMFLGIVALGPEFITLWIGPEYAKRGTGVLYLLVAASMVGFINPNGAKYLIASNQHGILAKVALISASINVGLSMALVPFFGIEGTAAGTLISYSLSEPYMLKVVCRILNISVWEYLKQAVLPVMPAAFALLAVLYLWKANWLVDSYMVLFLAASSSVMLYITLSFYTVLEREDRELCLRRVKRIISGQGGGA